MILNPMAYVLNKRGRGPVTDGQGDWWDTASGHGGPTMAVASREEEGNSPHDCGRCVFKVYAFLALLVGVC